jgi:hypothetical protein
MFKAALVLLLALCSETSAQSIHEEIKQIYSFAPHTLNKAELTKKSAELDEFWNKSKAKRAESIVGLRAELQKPGNPTFFYYDGGMLLLSLSDTPEDEQLVLEAIAKADIRDIQANEYFKQVHRFAVKQMNVTAAAFKILTEPKWSVFVPQHVLMLGQNYALVYMLLPTKQEFWENAAIERLSKESDETAQKSLLLLLMYAQTAAADKAMRDFANDSNKPAATRRYAEEMLEGQEHVSLGNKAASLLSTESGLREERRKTMTKVSDEALFEFDELTRKLIAKRH